MHCLLIDYHESSIALPYTGTTLVRLALRALQEHGAVCALLETEVNNLKALGLYEHLGFVR